MSENQIQASMFKWYHNTYAFNGNGIIFSCPNGGYRNKFEAVQLQATGLLPGVSDLMVNHKGKWLCVEVKDDTGRQSDAQKRFERIVTHLGTPYYIVRSLEEFKSIIEKYN